MISERLQEELLEWHLRREALELELDYVLTLAGLEPLQGIVQNPSPLAP